MYSVSTRAMRFRLIATLAAAGFLVAGCVGKSELGPFQLLVSYDELQLLEKGGPFEFPFSGITYDDELDSISIEAAFEKFDVRLPENVNDDDLVSAPANALLHASYIHVAAAMGHAGIVKKLLKLGAHVEMDCEIVGNYRYASVYPLHLAAIFGHSSVIRVLTRRRRVKVDKLSVLEWQGQTDLVSGEESTEDEEPKFGPVPLEFAADAGHLGAVVSLLEKGAKFTHAAFFYGCCSLREGAEDIVREGVKRGIDINLRSGRNETDSKGTNLGPGGDACLALAAHRGNKLVVSAALEFGAEINQMSMDGFTALDLSLLPASKHAANVGMPEFLINLGACL